MAETKPHFPLHAALLGRDVVVFSHWHAFALPEEIPQEIQRQIEDEAKAEGFDTWVAYYGSRKNPGGGKYAGTVPALGFVAHQDYI